MGWFVRLIMGIIEELQRREAEARQKQKKSTSMDKLTLDDWLETFEEEEAQPTEEIEQALQQKTSKKQDFASEKISQLKDTFEKVHEDGLHQGVYQNVDHDVHQNVHQGAYKLEDEKEMFQLPGKSPLEKMMWAQIVMGPCKAHRNKTVHF